MTNFIFKSVSTDLQKISQQIEVILHEQRLQRSDLSYIKHQLVFLTNDKNLQKQVDSYYADHPDSELEDS